MPDNPFVTKFINFQKELNEKLNKESLIQLEKQDRIDLFKMWIADEFELRVMAHQEKMFKLEIDSNKNKPDEPNPDDFSFGG